MSYLTLLLLLSLLIDYGYCNNVIKQPKYSITIAIISNNRLSSLKRLCNSLLVADYALETLKNLNLVFNLESTSSIELLSYVQSFRWPYGEKVIKKRLRKGGLITAVSESWYPASSQEHGIILEDDIEVSKFFMLWVVKCLNIQYHSHKKDYDERLIGISLYTPRVTETLNIHPDKFNTTDIIKKLGYHEETPFLMQTPCSWGALYFGDHWTKFLAYMQHRLNNVTITGANQIKPTSSSISLIIPYSRTNGWLGSWKKFMFEYMIISGYYMIYPNFKNQESLSTNHLEKGEHIYTEADSKKKFSFIVPLLENKEGMKKLQFMKLTNLPLFDIFGQSYLTNTDLKDLLNKNKLNVPAKYQDKYTFKSDEVLSTNGLHKRKLTSWFHTYYDKYSRKKICNEFPLYTLSYLSKFNQNSISIIITSFSNPRVLLKQLLHYAKSRYVHAIMVNIPNSFNIKLPMKSKIGKTFIYFRNFHIDTIHNPFIPSLSISTNCVLMVDDGILLSHHDIFIFFRIWKKNENNNNIIGVNAVTLSQSSSPSLSPSSYKNWDQFKKYLDNINIWKSSSNNHEKLILLSSKPILMFHQKYLHQYNCAIQSDYIDMKSNKGQSSCSDIIFNSLFNNGNYKHYLIKPIEICSLTTQSPSGNKKSIINSQINGDLCGLYDNIYYRSKNIQMINLNIKPKKYSNSSTFVQLEKSSFEAKSEFQLNSCASLKSLQQKGKIQIDYIGLQETK